MTGLLLAAVVIGAIGIIIGVLLGIASEKFKVEVDERSSGPCRTSGQQLWWLWFPGM